MNESDDRAMARIRGILRAVTDLRLRLDQEQSQRRLLEDQLSALAKSYALLAPRSVIDPSPDATA